MGRPNPVMDGDATTMTFFLSVIGMVMIVEGLPYFAFPERMKAVLQLMLEMPESGLRRVGAFLMLLGLGLVYMGKNLV
jgi:uncharacterized protein YjeT (DUF2065 family)